MNEDNPEQTPPSLEINNEAFNYGAQGIFYGPVSFTMPEEHSATKRGNRGAAFNYIQVIFEKNPRYPFLNFSVINNGEQPVQIASIRVVKAASLKDSHEYADYLLGPRTKLEFALKDVSTGEWIQVFGNDMVSNLNPGEAEAFQIRLDCKNTINLLDLEIEYLSPGLEEVGVCIPSDIIVIHSPLTTINGQHERATGKIKTIARKRALQAIIDEVELDLWRGEAFAGCQAWEGLFLKASGYLCRDSLGTGWNTLQQKFEGSIAFGLVLASFAELLNEFNFPHTISEYLFSWIHDPQKIMSIPVLNDEVDEDVQARIVFEKLVETKQGKSKEQFCLEVLESTLCVPDILDASDKSYNTKAAGMLSLSHVRGAALRSLIEIHNVGCVEYLVSVLFMWTAEMAHCNEYLSELLHQDTSNVRYQEQHLIEFWQNWWLRQDLWESYASLHWRDNSPRLLNALNALNSTEQGVISLLATNEDPVMRVAIARNPAAPASVLQILASDHIARIRSAVAKHPNTPLEVLRILAFDDYSSIRSWVASHPNADADLLALLAKDQSWHTQHAVAQHKNCSHEVLLMLSKSEIHAVRNLALKRLEENE
jgi:hypothetical protein